MSEDSLLDVFVKIGVKGIDESDQEIAGFVDKIEKAFGKLKGPKVSGSIKAKDLVNDDEIEKAKQILKSFREEVLRIGIERDELSIQVRLLGDADTTRKLQEIASLQAQVQKEFALATSEGDAGGQQAALSEIIRLRQEEVSVLREATAEELKSRGIDPGQEKAESFREATFAAQKFGLEVRDINNLVKQSGDSQLQEEFAAANAELSRLTLMLRQATTAGDLVGAENALEEINTLRVQIEALRDTANRKVVIATNIEELISDFSLAQKQFQSLNRLLSIKSSGQLNATQKIEIAEIEKEIRDIIIAFNALAKTTDITAANFQELRVLAARFSEAAEGVKEIKEAASGASISTNQLSNNAYQLGQAFEDAAVGFSLNGVSGAIRGASNNVSFLINNLAQAGSLNNLVGESAARLIPVYAGVAAAALLILPVLYDWLETLDDIGAKSRDISDDLNREFSDASFKISLVLDAQDAVKAVKEAKDAVAAVEAVIKQAEDTQRLQFKIASELDLISKKAILSDVDLVLDDVQNALDRRLFSVSKPNVVFSPEVGGEPTVLPPDQAEIAKVGGLRDAVDTLRASLKETFAQSQKGIVDRDALQKANDSSLLLVKGYEQLIASGVLTEAELKNIKASLEAVQSAMEKANEEAQKLFSQQENTLGPVLKAAVEATKGLSREYEFQRAINDGRLSDEDRILFTMQEQELAIERQNKALLDATGNSPIAQQVAAQNELLLQQQQRVDLAKEVRDIEKEIAEKQKEAAKDARDANNDLIKSQQKLADAQEAGQKKVADAREALQAELDRQSAASSDQLIQDQIDALTELQNKNQLTSQQSQLGDIGKVVIGDGQDKFKVEIDRLRDQLQNARDLRRQAEDAARISQLRQRIVDIESANEKRKQELEKELQDAFEKNKEATDKAAEEINKLSEEMKKLREAIIENDLGNPTSLPGGVDLNVGANGPVFAPEGIPELAGSISNANNQALEETDFRSSSLEKLIESGNSIMGRVDESIKRLDLASRYS